MKHYLSAPVPKDLWEAVGDLAFFAKKTKAALIREGIILMMKHYGDYDLYDWDGLVPTAHGRSVFEEPESSVFDDQACASFKPR